MSYQSFEGEAYLSDSQGNLIDFDGTILVSKDEVAHYMILDKKGEEFEFPEAVQIGEIFDETDELPVGLDDAPEIM